MTLWIDAQLSPQLADWLSETFDIEAIAVRDLGLRDAEDAEIFDAAREAGAVVLTKDQDFVDMVARRGPPPQLLWITIGNTSNASLKRVLEQTLPEALDLIGKNEPLVEIAGER